MYKKVKLNFLTVPCPARLCLNKPNTIFLGSGLKLVLFVALNHPTTWRVQYMICFIYHYIHWFIHHGNTWTHKWPTTNICSRFIKLSWLERHIGIVRSWVQTSLKSWIFQTSLRNCKNCVHNCEDHYSSIWFHIRNSIHVHGSFHTCISFHSKN